MNNHKVCKQCDKERYCKSRGIPHNPIVDGCFDATPQDDMMLCPHCGFETALLDIDGIDLDSRDSTATVECDDCGGKIKVSCEMIYTIKATPIFEEVN
jgi:transcription elongation factor Elf1